MPFVKKQDPVISGYKHSLEELLKQFTLMQLS